MTLPTVPHKIILPNGQDKLIKRRVRAVIPNKNEVTLRCNKCGSTDFTVIGKPDEKTGILRIAAAVCSVCASVSQFNDKGQIGGVLKLEKLNGIKHREAINDRPDN